MGSIAFAEALSIYDALDADLDKADGLDLSALSHAERMQLMERREAWRRRLPAGEHELINQLAKASVEELGGTPSHVLANGLRINRSEARRRIAEAADLGPRRALTGEPLPPKLEATAAGSARERSALSMCGSSAGSSRRCRALLTSRPRPRPNASSSRWRASIGRMSCRASPATST
jgi:hypothetical protein